jgi:hypothetical protein
MAKKSAQLFVGQAQPPANRNAPRVVTEIQLRALQMLFDIVMVFHFCGLEREGGPKDGVSFSSSPPHRLTYHLYTGGENIGCI